MMSVLIFHPEQPAGSIARIEGLDLAMVWCPPGEFRMGEHPGRDVRLTSGFWIGQTPVTQEQWLLVMKKRHRIWDEGRQLPVDAIAWHDASAFCQDASSIAGLPLQLPTEAEWEYACRAGTRTRWHFGDEESRLPEFAWFRANSGSRKHPVGSKLPNPWGLFDCYGNVAEWCDDTFSLPGNAPAADPVVRQDMPLHVTRGGDYTCLASECSSVSRGVCDAANPFNESTGLRVVARRPV